MVLRWTEQCGAAGPRRLAHRARGARRERQQRAAADRAGRRPQPARGAARGRARLRRAGAREPARRRARLPAPRRRAHPDRLRPSALRLRPGAAGARPDARCFFTVTAFTLGHSVTLSLAALGFVHFPSRLDRGGDRRDDPAAGGGAGAPRPGPAPARCAARPGAWPAASACCTGSASPARWPRWGCRRDGDPAGVAQLQRSASRSGSCAFVALVLCAGWLRRGAARARARLAGSRAVTAMGTLAAYWCFERGAAALGL